MLVNQVDKCFLFLQCQLNKLADWSKVGKENYKVNYRLINYRCADAAILIDTSVHPLIDLLL